ncbi:collagen alpha-1(VIII) chain-like isoform X1 [Lates japonicus]|uniref:Collagen alpha-1(VIII) chain-like isoform X1 n=1 Tax=Lates japonicus TaxID=270547 RepID=A0AAD3N1L7_LATJO|nr:collagen alpha-1(VIII) chain-like isoform X1 [Lates japonicus]
MKTISHLQSRLYPVALRSLSLCQILKPSTKDGEEHFKLQARLKAASETTGLTARQKYSEVVMKEQTARHHINQKNLPSQLDLDFSQRWLTKLCDTSTLQQQLTHKGPSRTAANTWLESRAWPPSHSCLGKDPEKRPKVRGSRGETRRRKEAQAKEGATTFSLRGGEL